MILLTPKVALKMVLWVRSLNIEYKLQSVYAFVNDCALIQCTVNV